MIKTTTLFMILIAFSGCSSFCPKKDIYIKAVDNVTNNNLDGVICTVTDGSGKIYNLATNPGIVKVKKSSSSLLIYCKKEGYRQLSSSVGNNFDNMNVVNVLAWPGFNIDRIAKKSEKYPSHYLVSMEKLNIPE